MKEKGRGEVESSLSWWCRSRTCFGPFKEQSVRRSGLVTKTCRRHCSGRRLRWDQEGWGIRTVQVATGEAAPILMQVLQLRDGKPPNEVEMGTCESLIWIHGLPWGCWQHAGDVATTAEAAQRPVSHRTVHERNHELCEMSALTNGRGVRRPSHPYQRPP
jgi:hypothetical protein